MAEEKLMPVRVAVRCRPLVSKEVNEGCQQCLTYIPGEPQLVLGADKAFTFDRVFNPDVPQAQVYEESIKTLVKGLFKGYNATVLAYGQTGSGKTFTMGGAYDTGVDDALKGVIPRVISDLFEGISLRATKYDFVVKVSYLEIYKEELVDLLIPVSARVKDMVVIREDPLGGIQLNGLQERVVSDPEETVGCLEKGALGRTVGATSMNSTSSRSHAIFTIHVSWTSKEDSNDYCKVKFHLVDLAGSERAKKTHAEGERFKEGVNINKGLLALGNVISALGDDTQKRPHIPYRDSKLTRLLQDSLGGNSNTVMIACISPADSNMEETLSTLRYADRARKIKNKPIVNRDPQAAEIMRLKTMVQQLQNQVLENGGTLKADVSRSSLNSSQDGGVYKEIISRLEEENNKLKMELVNAIHQNTAMYEKMVETEALNDRLKDSLAQLKEKTGLNMSLLESNPEMQQKIAEIHNQIVEMETIHDSRIGDDSPVETTVSTDCTTITSDATTLGMARSPSNGGANYTTEDVLKEAQLKNKMYALNDMLDAKEALLKEINSNNVTFDIFHQKYESELKERETQISELTKEKDALSSQLSSAKAALNSTKVGDQRRQRVKELEAKISAMQRENKEQMKLLRCKEASAKDSARLASEITDLKRQRVTLMKQMRAESEASRKWKQLKEKEVMQLKAKERRQQVEYQKMERKNVQQQAVLKRKGEEAAAANRRLKDALMKQKQVLADRGMKQERHDASNQARFKKWLDNELEVVVSVEENRHHLEQMRSQRKELTARLTQLKDELLIPPTKRKLMNNSKSEETDETKQKAGFDITEVEEDLKHVNKQIAETQQRIVEADQDEKYKTRWEEVRTLMDARCALRILLDKAVKAQVERLKEVSKAVEAEAELEEKSHIVNGLQQKVTALKESHNRALTAVRAEAQRRVAPLLTLLNQKVLTQEGVASAGQLTQEELDRLADVQEELEKKTCEVDQLQKTLTKTNIKQRRGDTSYFGHLDSTPKMENKLRNKIRLCEQEIGTPLPDNTEKDPDWAPSLPPGPKKEQKKKGSLYSADSTTVDDTLNVTMGTCRCKGDCSSKRCRCRKNNTGCTDGCKCSSAICANRATSEDVENIMTSTINSTFVMESSNDADTISSLDTTEERPKRKSSGVKRTSTGEPRTTLSEKNNNPILRHLFPSTESLNSSDEFSETTLGSRRRLKSAKKPFFSALN